MATGSRAVKRAERNAAMAAMRKPDGHHYSAHDADFFEC